MAPLRLTVHGGRILFLTPYGKAKKILFENAKVHKVEIKPVYEEKGLFKSMFAYEAGGEEKDIARFINAIQKV